MLAQGLAEVFAVNLQAYSGLLSKLCAVNEIYRFVSEGE
jgi:hypothetical protein